MAAVDVSSTTTTDRTRLPALEGLRAVAAFAVVVYHLSVYTFAVQSNVAWAFGQLDIGVWIFFALSGFLLYAPFVAAHVDARRRVDPRGYLWRRLLRIYPAYWVALIVVPWLLTPAFRFPDTGSAIRAGLLVHTYVDPRNVESPGLQQSWTLVVEMSFYLFLPVYAAVIARLARPARPARRRSLARVEWLGLGVLSVAGIATSVVLAFVDGPLWAHVLPMHLFAFAVGMAAAVARAHGVHVFGVRTGVAIFAVVWGALVLYASIVEPTGRAWTSTRTVLFAVAAGALVAPFTRQEEAGALARLLRSRPFVFLGAVSYGIYLWHVGWIGFFYLRGIDQGVSFTFVKLALVAVPCTVITAWLSYRIVERPAIGLSRRLAARAR